MNGGGLLPRARRSELLLPPHAHVRNPPPQRRRRGQARLPGHADPASSVGCSLRAGGVSGLAPASPTRPRRHRRAKAHGVCATQWPPWQAAVRPAHGALKHSVGGPGQVGVAAEAASARHAQVPHMSENAGNLRRRCTPRRRSLRCLPIRCRAPALLRGRRCPVEPAVCGGARAVAAATRRGAGLIAGGWRGAADARAIARVRTLGGGVLERVVTDRRIGAARRVRTRIGAGLAGARVRRRCAGPVVRAAAPQGGAQDEAQSERDERQVR